MALGQQFEQLSMFMAPKALRARYRPGLGEIRSGESKAQMWARKAAEGRLEGLSASVAQEGVHTPVSVTPVEILDGHHRLAVASPQQFIPVLHHANYNDYHRNFARDDQIWPARKGR
jgi:hypothetical protein